MNERCFAFAELSKLVRIKYTQAAFLSYNEQGTECSYEVSYPTKYQHYWKGKYGIHCNNHDSWKVML